MEALTVVEQKCLQPSELCRKSTLVPLLITLVLQAVQNWCGVNVIVFKTVHVFQTFQTSVDSYLATAVVGGVQLLATFSKKYFKYSKYFSSHCDCSCSVSLCLMDRAGRRVLLMVSGLMMTISMSCLALYLTLLPSLAQSWRWLPLPLVTLAFTGYSVGFATVPLSLIGELLPAR